MNNYNIYSSCIQDGRSFSKSYTSLDGKLRLTLVEPVKSDIDGILNQLSRDKKLGLPKPLLERRASDYEILVYSLDIQIGRINISYSDLTDISSLDPKRLKGALQRLAILSETAYNIIVSHIDEFKRTLNKVFERYAGSRSDLEELALAYLREKEARKDDKESAALPEPTETRVVRSWQGVNVQTEYNPKTAMGAKGFPPRDPAGGFGLPKRSSRINGATGGTGG